MNTARETSRCAEILEGVPVWSCSPGSPSARAGVQPGDIVLAVNGIRVHTPEEYFDARCHAEGPLRLRVWRLGREFSVTIEFTATNEARPSGMVS